MAFLRTTTVAVATSDTRWCSDGRPQLRLYIHPRLWAYDANGHVSQLSSCGFGHLAIRILQTITALAWQRHNAKGQDRSRRGW